MIEHQLPAKLFSIGSLNVYYYGLFYVLGIIFILWYLQKYSRFLDGDEASDFVFYLVIGMLVGARLVYVVVYNLEMILQNPFEFFAVWHGGLSFHGGVIGALAAAWLYLRTRKNNVSVLHLADEAVIPLSLALALGRIGNFFNGELYGVETNVAWCVLFQQADLCRHPSQLYESLKNVLIFCALLIMHSNGLWKVKGGIFWSFIGLYGAFRFIIQLFWRVEPVWMFGLSKGSLLCLIMIVCAGVGLGYCMWKVTDRRSEEKA